MAQHATVEHGLYDRHERSLAQRLVLAAFVAVCVLASWWLLLAGGVGVVGTWLDRTWASGRALRQLSLAVALTIYFVRLLFTQFVFLQRALGWSEVFTVAPWVAFIFLLLSIVGGLNAAPMGTASVAGVALFLLGSWMNTYAELARHRWKARPGNRGQLYTAGLFRVCRHPNYLGDLLSFSGLAVLAGSWWGAVIPLTMLAGFVFVNVPMLDAHLLRHYGQAFADYAARTRKLIPLLY